MSVIRRIAAAVPWVCLAVPPGIAAVSVALSPQTTPMARGLAGAFLLLALVRPDAALLATFAFGGFGAILAMLCGVPPLRMGELMVVLSLIGCCVAAARRPQLFGRAMSGWLAVPVVLLAIAAAASTAVWLRVEQFQTGYAGPYVQGLLQAATHDYFTTPGNLWVVVATAIIVEGLALFLFVAAWCRIDPTFFDRALRMLAVGGAGLGFMSVVRLAEIVLRNPDALAAVRATSVGLRISPQIPDYIAAGSYFAVCWIVSLGLSASTTGRARVGWVAAGLPLIAALYLTGSRSVIAAVLAGLLVMGLALARRRATLARAVVVLAVVVVAVMVLTYQRFIGRDAAGEMAMQSVTVRLELMKAGLGVIGTRPLFGVGLDRFYLVAGEFASPTLRALWGGRMNPHNDFLRFGGELGIIGLTLFVWVLVHAALRIGRGLQRSGEIRLAAVTGGVAAFLVTSCVSNPLMVREVSHVFWIALGLAVGAASGAVSEPQADAAAVTRRRDAALRWAAIAAIGLVLVASIPSRAENELATVNVSRLSYGFHEWGTDPDGAKSRWSGPRATLFVDARARGVEIPLSGASPFGAPQEVEIRLDGRVANRVSIGSDRQYVRLMLPASKGTFPRRIDLTVRPTWVPAQLIPGNQDRRELGVKVGELKVMM